MTSSVYATNTVGNTNRLYHADNRLNPITSMDAETNVILV